MKLRPYKNPKPSRTKSRLQLLTSAALILPGLLQVPAYAADEDEADFQYSHYQEGQRGSGTGMLYSNNTLTGIFKKYPIFNNRAPIEVDSIHGSSRISLTDRIKFGFNYVEDTWAGATPIGSAPEQSGAYGSKHQSANERDANGDPVLTGATPLATHGQSLIDSKGNFYYPDSFDPVTGKPITYAKDRMVHVMGYASPETRKQGDFKLGYQWDEAGLDVGGGVSDERDYHSSFANLGGHMDFNRKMTSLNLGLSYTNSDTDAIALQETYGGGGASIRGSRIATIDPETGVTHIRGNRQDWTSHLGLTQVINQDAVLNLGMGYSRNTGYLSNPYKLTWFCGIDPAAPLVGGYQHCSGFSAPEQRPEQRNLLNWNLGWTQYVQPFDAALHANYQFAHDDWGVNAHTFDADWVQPLGAGWALTPRIRYYSQEAANFYSADPRFNISGSTLSYLDLPKNWSSDQRLSGYGALSGGVVLSKQFAKGISLETGFEYYSHQGALKLGGGGEQNFANYDYWVVNGALKLNLSTLGQGLGGGGTNDHAEHANHGNVPAGLMFAHTLGKAGDMMAGYRYQHSRQAGDYGHGDRTVNDDQMAINGCPGAFRDAEGFPQYDGNCPMVPKEMVMNMHMLELMYAPTDRLTLMLMPQFADMSMVMAMPTSAFNASDMKGMMQSSLLHESGGIGDTGAYALYTLFDKPGQHLHISLGGTAPTGTVRLKLKEGVTHRDIAFKDYSMQLGSGTWDLKPSLTYLGQTDDWSWGGQLSGTKRLGDRNAPGYRLGDIFESSVWGGYNLTRWLSSTLRLAYSWQDSIQGRFTARNPNKCNGNYNTKYNFDEFGNPIGDPVFNQVHYDGCIAGLPEQNHQADAQDHMSSQDYPRNYGGHYLDLGLGVSATVPSGSLAGNKLSFEWLQPMYTNVNGYQLNRDGALTFTWSYGF